MELKTVFRISFLSLFIFIFSLQSLGAQRNADFALFWKYREYPSSISFTVPGLLIKFGSVFVKGKARRKLIRKVGKTRIMVFEDDNPVKEKDVKRLVRRAERGGLETLVTVRDEGSRVHIMGRERKGKIRKLLVLVREDDEFVMVSVKCKIKLDELGDLFKEVQDRSGSGMDTPMILPVQATRG